jgi:hypothetical protein
MGLGEGADEACNRDAVTVTLVGALITSGGRLFLGMIEPGSNSLDF